MKIYLKFQKKKKQKNPPATASSCSTTSKKPKSSAAISTKPIQARLNPASDTRHHIEHQITLEHEEEAQKDEERGVNTTLRAVSLIPASDNNNDMRRPEERATTSGDLTQKSVMNGFQSESCLLEQLRISENWR